MPDYKLYGFDPQRFQEFVQALPMLQIYYDQGRFAEVEAIQRRYLQTIVAIKGPMHQDLWIPLVNLADSVTERGRFSEAEELLRRALSIVESAREPDHPDVAEVLQRLGRLHHDLGRYVEAEPLLRQALAIREKTIPDDWTTFATRSLLGGSLLGQAKCAEAELFIVQGYEGMKDREAQIPPSARNRLIEAGERVVRLYEAWGKPDEAAEWRARLLGGSESEPDL
jgi:tetratricopeptide (TPR) repeat protein